MGESTFLDRFDDQDFIDSVSDKELKNLGFENIEQFQANVGQSALTGTIGAMGEAADQGDPDKMERLGKGLVNQADLLGEDPAKLQEVTDAYQDIYSASRGVLKSSGDAAVSRLEDAAKRLEREAAELNNPVSSSKFRVGGAFLGLAVGSGLAWHQALSDGNLTLGEGIQASIPTLENLFGVGEALAVRSGGTFLKLGQTGFSRAGKVFGGLGLVLDGISIYQAVKAGDPVQAGVSVLGAVGSIATLAGATGVGAAIGLGAAAIGLAYGQYKKVEASNRHESAEAEAFIRGALEQSGLTGVNLDDVTHHLRNADSEGRQTGILIQQAAERAGLEPIELLTIIARQDKDNILKIVETGHGVDPTGNTLDSLEQENAEKDGRIGENIGPRSSARFGPETVEGFLIWLESQGYVDRNAQGKITGSHVL